jgi:hypothetical protein
MSNALKRLSNLEKAIEQLLQRDKYYILVRKDDTPEEAVKWHVEHRWLDLSQKEPFFIHSKIPGKSRPMQYKATDSTDLPVSAKPTLAQELAMELKLPKPPEPDPNVRPKKARDEKAEALRQQLRIEQAYKLMAKSIA